MVPPATLSTSGSSTAECPEHTGPLLAYLTVSTGFVGGFDELTCNPTVTFWPADSLVVQSDPVQVTEVLGIAVHVTPQEFAIPETFGSFHVMDHAGTDFSAVTSRLATYPPFHELVSLHNALTEVPVDGVGPDVAVGEGRGVGTVALGEGDGFTGAVWEGAGVGVAPGTAFRIGASAASFAASGVRQSLLTRPPVTPEFGLNDQ